LNSYNFISHKVPLNYCNHIATQNKIIMYECMRMYKTNCPCCGSWNSQYKKCIYLYIHITYIDTQFIRVSVNSIYKIIIYIYICVMKSLIFDVREFEVRFLFVNFLSEMFIFFRNVLSVKWREKSQPEIFRYLYTIAHSKSQSVYCWSGSVHTLFYYYKRKPWLSDYMLVHTFKVSFHFETFRRKMTS